MYFLQDHSRFVNCVRYAPNGDFFVSGGAEGKVCLACFLMNSIDTTGQFFL